VHVVLKSCNVTAATTRYKGTAVTHYGEIRLC